MANAERGEVALVVGDRTYTLVTDFEARCQVEAELSTPEHAVPYWRAALLAAQFSDTHVRAIFWGSLRRHHKDVSLEQAGNLIDQLGGSGEFLSTLAKLRGVSEPEEDTGRRPPKARQPRIRAGARTTSTPGASASRLTSSGG